MSPPPGRKRPPVVPPPVDWADFETSLAGGINTTLPDWTRCQHAALGGRDAFPSDHRYLEAVAREWPRLDLPETARHDLAFQARVTRFLSTGAACGHVTVPLHDLPTIVFEAGRTLDLTRPVAVLLLSQLQQITDDEQARALVRAMAGGLASGSHLAVTHPAAVVHGDAMPEALGLYHAVTGRKLVTRSPEQIAGLLDGLEVLAPGVVPVSRWRPPPDRPPPPEVDLFAAVATKP